MCHTNEKSLFDFDSTLENKIDWLGLVERVAGPLLNFWSSELVEDIQHKTCDVVVFEAKNMCVTQMKNLFLIFQCSIVWPRWLLFFLKLNFLLTSSRNNEDHMWWLITVKRWVPPPVIEIILFSSSTHRVYTWNWNLRNRVDLAKWEDLGTETW